MNDDPLLPPRLQVALLLGGISVLLWLALLGWRQFGTPSAAPATSPSQTGRSEGAPWHASSAATRPLARSASS